MSSNNREIIIGISGDCVGIRLDQVVCLMSPDQTREIAAGLWSLASELDRKLLHEERRQLLIDRRGDWKPTIDGRAVIPCVVKKGYVESDGTVSSVRCDVEIGNGQTIAIESDLLLPLKEV